MNSCYNLSGPTGCVTTPPALTATILYERTVMAESSLPKTCAAAKAAGLPFFYTGEPCKYGHLAVRRTSDRKCVACDKRRSDEQWARHREAKLAACQRYKDTHRPQISAYMRGYNAANAKRIAAAKAVCYQARKEYYSVQSRDRETREIKATPLWLTDADWTEMKWIYAKAARLTRETGILHEVDHIIPLRGRNVCGLHVPANLQVLTRTANRSKGNKHGD